jgi:prepilin-type N-terminal cleavage/methylation domain-containing protein/prepilin-type processing-associated H-X9-DG protein
MKTHPSRGFTLIELLTVIAIIGILAAIIIPVVGKVRTTARASAALSGIRDLANGVLVYANDNRNFLPMARDPGTNITWNMAIVGLTGEAAIRATMVDPVFAARSGSELLYSPTHQPTRCGAGLTLNPFLSPESDQYWLTYGQGGTTTLANITRVTDHSRRILLATSNDWHFHPGTATPAEWVPAGDGIYRSGDPERHGGKAPYVMFDGSAKMLNKTDAYWAWRRPTRPPSS